MSGVTADVGDHVRTIRDRLKPIPQREPRNLIAIAGPPGGGKSTVAEALVGALNEYNGAGHAALVPMDGYHLDNTVLDARGLRAVKGAPETFDAAGFAALVNRIRSETGPIRYPLFDRAQDCAVADVGELSAETRFAVIEGNYLLCDLPVWRDLAPLFDLAIMLHVPIATLEARLIQRWLDQGFSPEAAAQRARGNDLANARTVLERSVTADLTLQN